MFVVIFEVQPNADRWDEYLGLAKKLKAILESTDGFIDNERFRSLRVDGHILSLSTWRDEKSVVRWRTNGEHHGVQERGRDAIFKDYHLRVGEVTCDTHIPTGQALVESRFDETEAGEANVVTITEVDACPPDASSSVILAELSFSTDLADLTGWDLFDSITNPGKRLLLASWKLARGDVRWSPLESQRGERDIRHRTVRVVRDYGMFDRREAPQYYPDAPSAGTN